MDNIDDTAVKLLIHRVGLKYHMQDSIINKIVTSPYKFTKATIVAMDVESIITEEDFNNLKTNFIYKYIGKVYATYAVLTKHRAHSQKLIEYHKLNKIKNE